MNLSPRAAFAVLPLLAGLASCAANITGGERLTSVDPDAWTAHRPTLPVEIHGALPGGTQADLAALFPAPARQAQYASNGGVALETPPQRIVMYVNAGNLPPNPQLCGPANNLVAAPQAGNRAKITAALCDGATAVSVARADVTADQSAATFKAGLEEVQDQLFQSLYPYHVLTAGVPVQA